MLNSFKLRLVVYFLVLAVVPAAAAFWGFATVTGTNRTHAVDTRLQDGLRAALVAYQERLDRASAAAQRVAQTRAVQVALARRDRAALAQLLQGTPDVAVVAPGGFRVGEAPAPAAHQRVDVVTPSGRIGAVVSSVPLDASLVVSLRAHAGLDAVDVLALVRSGRIAVAKPPLAGRIDLVAGRTATIPVDGVRYRALVAPPLAGVSAARIAALSPQARIDAATAAARVRLLIGLLVCLAIVSVVAYLEGRSIVRMLGAFAHAAGAIARGRFGERVPVRGRDELARVGGAFNDMAEQLEGRLAELQLERARLGQQIARFGEALSATHDGAQLLRLVAVTAVEATGAAGARLRAADGTLVEEGDPDAPGDRIELELAAGEATHGTLLLVGERFGDMERATAETLAAQAAIALDNARLHRLVERQAILDGLTGVANRRRCEEALRSEVARADRLGTPLTLVLADLDDFKRVNDQHGHAAGDDALRAFGTVLRRTVRGSDVAGRWGGEEFLLLLPGADADGAARLADRIRRAIAAWEVSGPRGAFVVTASFGVAAHRAGAGVEELFAAADRALYRAKRGGKDRVEVEFLIRTVP